MDCGSDQELVTTGNFPAGPSAATVMDAGAVAAVTAAGGRGLATMLQRAANISSPPPEPAAPTPSGPPPDGGNQAPGRGPQERPASENRVGMPPSAATYCSYPIRRTTPATWNLKTTCVKATCRHRSPDYGAL